VCRGERCSDGLHDSYVIMLFPFFYFRVFFRISFSTVQKPTDGGSLCWFLLARPHYLPLRRKSQLRMRQTRAANRLYLDGYYFFRHHYDRVPVNDVWAFADRAAHQKSDVILHSGNRLLYSCPVLGADKNDGEYEWVAE